MSVVAVIIAVVTGIVAWWWRIQRARNAASTVIDFAARARGVHNRYQLRKRAGVAVLSGVEDAGTAAAILLYSLAALKGPVMRADEELMDRQLEEICGLNPRDRDDAVAFAASAVGEVSDVNEIIRCFKPLWRKSLGARERKQLIDMAIEIAERGSAPNDAQKSSIRMLSEDLLLH